MAALRIVVILAGLAWSAAFIVVGVGYGLQMYADGSIFSYAVAVQDGWAFHYSNISGRVFVYLFSFLPSESYIGLTGDAHGGVVVFGLLQFSVHLLGLAATYAADRSPGRIVFATACASTALLVPLVFGFPTEMRLSHAIFWPALALCHDAPRGVRGIAVMVLALLALVLTHEGGVVLGLAIMVTLVPRGLRDAALRRGVATFAVALAVWAVVKLTLPPDAYFGSIVEIAALMLIDPSNLVDPIGLVLLGALAAYGVVFLLLQRARVAQAHIYAAGIVAALLIVYWLWFDRSLHTDDRYELRTALLYGTPVFGAIAAAFALKAAGRLVLPIPLLPWAMAFLARPATVRAAIGAVAVVTLVHVVETAKFVAAWSDYKAAVRTLAMGSASDPALGDPRFVSSARLGARLNRLSWFSTTPYLSVLLAPRFAPARLVIDPAGDYFWLSCATATANERAERAIPVESRRLIRIYSCLHRDR
jgi:hypothetical protein